eukprot:884337-Rhodomonas_salina.1
MIKGAALKFQFRNSGGPGTPGLRISGNYRVPRRILGSSESEGGIICANWVGVLTRVRYPVPEYPVPGVMHTSILIPGTITRCQRRYPGGTRYVVQFSPGSFEQKVKKCVGISTDSEAEALAT